MIVNAYGNSPSSAVLDLIDHDGEFSVIKGYGLREWDFNPAPQNLWTDKKKKPTDTAREATKELIKVLASKKGVDYHTKEGFKEILSELTQDNFYKKPINYWDTTLGGMIKAYKYSPSSAVLDLIKHDDELSRLRKHKKAIKASLDENNLHLRSDRFEGIRDGSTNERVAGIPLPTRELAVDILSRAVAYSPDDRHSTIADLRVDLATLAKRL